MYLQRFDPLRLHPRAVALTPDVKDRALASHGMPLNLLGAKRPDAFCTLDTEVAGVKKHVDDDEQEEYFHLLLENPGTKVVFLGSVPTDSTALGAAAFLHRRWIGDGIMSYMVDVLNPYQPADAPDAIILFNILPSAMNSEALQVIRGCLYGYTYSARIFVVAGDPLVFAKEVVHVRPNGIAYFEEGDMVF